MPQIVASLTDDSGGIIYNHYMLIVEALVEATFKGLQVKIPKDGIPNGEIPNKEGLLSNICLEEKMT
jgi:hypothetical protein